MLCTFFVSTSDHIQIILLNRIYSIIIIIHSIFVLQMWGVVYYVINPELFAEQKSPSYGTCLGRF